MKGLKEIKSYANDLVEALEERFGDAFKDPLTKEKRDLLDLGFMLKLEDDIKQVTTYLNSLYYFESA